MRIYASLSRLYLGSFYNLPGKRAPGEKLGAKAVLKGIGVAALVVLVVADLGALFVATNFMLYEALAGVGMQGMLFLNAAVMATMLTMVVGFLTALSTYFMNDMELQLLSMPIPPRALFGAKFTAVYSSEAAFSVFFMATAMIIFGVKEHPHPVFYLWGTLSALLLPLPALAVAYFIQVPLMGAVRFLRNKQAILVVGGVLGIAVALGFNVYYQGMMTRVGDPEWLRTSFAGPDSIMARMGEAYPPAQLIWRAMSHPATGQAALSMLALAAICLAAPALVIFGLGGAYAKSLVGFNESHVRKLTAGRADAFVAREAKRGRVFLSLVAREVRLMNREPMYLLNGPFIIVLMPVIFGIMLAVQKDALLSDPDLAGVMAMINTGGGAVLAGLIGAFLGSGTSIACTALSRDAKALGYIKSMPIPAGSYMLAKLAHGLAFAAFGAVTGVGLLGWALGLSALDMAAGLAVAVGLSSLINLAGLWLDTANPRLKWDNPMAALKQNPNSVIVILGTMGLMGGAGYLAFTRHLDAGQCALWFGALPALAFVLLLIPYRRFAERKLDSIEA